MKTTSVKIKFKGDLQKKLFQKLILHKKFLQLISKNINLKISYHLQCA